jgi:glutamate carboxypeptidase
MSALLAYLNQNKEALLGDLERLVRAESPSNEKAAVDRCGHLLQELFVERLGARMEVYPQRTAGNHLRFTIGDGDRQILILGHFDTVWDIGRLTYRVEGRRAFGPGIFDMKGGIVQALWAARAIRETRIPAAHSAQTSREKVLDSCQIVFLLTSDEEVGSVTSRQLVEEEARKSQVVFVVEPPVVGTNALKTGRKGVGRFTVRIKGKAAHAGNNPEDGISAVQEMAQQILILHGLSDYSLGTTINAGIARGGARANVVAEEAEIHLDVRVTKMTEAERIKSALNALAPVLPGATISVEGGLVRPPMERGASTIKLFELASRCARQLGLELTEASVGGGSDGNFTAALGIPTLDGLGAVGAGIHAEHEQVLIDQLPIRAALLGELILAVSQE